MISTVSNRGYLVDPPQHNLDLCDTLKPKTSMGAYRWKVTEVRTFDNLVEEVPLRAAFLAACFPS